MKVIFIILSLLFLTSCNPYQFYLNFKAGDLYEVYNMSALESIEKKNDNSIEMIENSKVSIRNFTVVHNVIQFNLLLLKGNHIKFALRNIRHEYDENKSFLMDLTNNKVKFYNKGVFLGEIEVDIKPNEQKLIQIFNFGKTLKISMDCAEIFNSSLNQPNTEYIIIETDENTKASISGINFEQTK